LAKGMTGICSRTAASEVALFRTISRIEPGILGNIEGSKESMGRGQ